MKPECCTQSEWDEIRSSAAHASDDSMTLDELTATLKAHFGDDFLISHRERGDGTGEAVLTVKGVRRATWCARLINPPPRDGVTPRGKREYYALRFFPHGPKLKPLHRSGVPMNAEDWTEQDWMDLSEAVQTAIEKIAARHKK